MTEPAHTLTRRLPGVSIADAEARIRSALAAEGFGILTEIDLRATLHKKLGVERRPYKILGACNPRLAHAALEAQPSVGVFLPCNVNVLEDETGTTVLQAMNPMVMADVTGSAALAGVATEVGERLNRALDAAAGIPSNRSTP